jgi:predicted DNA-binding protein
MTPQTRGRGRPATGLQAGERVSDYARMTIRLPPVTKARLEAAAMLTGRPAWRIILEGIDQVLAALPPTDRALIDKLAKRVHAERGES